MSTYHFVCITVPSGKDGQPATSTRFHQQRHDHITDIFLNVMWVGSMMMMMMMMKQRPCGTMSRLVIEIRIHEIVSDKIKGMQCERIQK